MLDTFLPSPNSLLVNLRESKEVQFDMHNYAATFIILRTAYTHIFVKCYELAMGVYVYTVGSEFVGGNPKDVC